MDLLEYQGKQLFARAGVAVPEGEPADDVETAVAAADRIGYPCVIKAQVLIGGRGKAGGIKVAKDATEARAHAEAILGMDIVGPHGEGPFTVHRGLGRAGLGDRRRVLRLDHPRPLGEDAARDPLADGRDERRGDRRERSRRARPPPRRSRWSGSPTTTPRSLAVDAGIDEDVVEGVARSSSQLYGAFNEFDATLIEVNPLIVTSAREVVALDAKVTIDGCGPLPARGARRDRGSARPTRRSGWPRSGA